MDIPFVGKECEVPIFSDVHNFRVGVFAGNLHTTTSAYVPAKKSILCGTGDKPIVPKEDAYDKMMEDINADAVRAETAANKAEEKLADMQERYYTPSVNEAGDLSWEANDEGMPEVPMVNIKGQKGDKGDPGEDGYSPTVGVSTIDGGHRVRFVDKNGAVAMNVMDGQDGQDGQDGVSPNVTVQPITGGNRVTFTDASGSKTFDVMNGEPGKPGVNAENDELFVVRTLAGNKADKTVAEIREAVAAGKVCLLLNSEGAVYKYRGEEKPGSANVTEATVPTFYRGADSNYSGIQLYRAQIPASDNIVRYMYTTCAKTPNPNKLKFTGAVSAEYDGSADVTVEIPAGGDGGSGLPTGGEPHQMLVTDAEGKAKWEPKKHITGEIDNTGHITFSMPVADMFALGDGLREYDITITDKRYTDTSCRVGEIHLEDGKYIYLYAFERSGYIRVILYEPLGSANFSTVSVPIDRLPDPNTDVPMYVVARDGSYHLESAPTGSASTPMLQVLDADGVMSFVSMDTGEPFMVTFEILMEMYGNSLMNLKLIVMNANTGTEMSIFSFGYINMSEDPENPPYILFGSPLGKTIRMEVDGALSYVQ